jgi:hypothetical protein
MGALELGAGHRGQAHGWLSQAIDELRAMKIAVWREQAERLFGETTLPRRLSD